MTQTRVLTTNEGVPLNAGIGFNAWSVIVDNLSSSWAVIGSTGRAVAPFTYGASLPFPSSVIQANVAWQTPAGLLPPTAGIGQLTLTYTTDVLPYNPGVTVLQAQPMGAATPPVAQVPNVQYANFAGQMAAASNSTIVAGKAGQTIILYGLMWGYTPLGGAGFYECAVGDSVAVRTVDIIFVNTTAVNLTAYPLRHMAIPGGAPLTAGASLVLVTGANTGAIDVSATAFFTQS